MLWKARKKKSVESRSKEQRRDFSELSLEIGFGIMTAMILQNTISRLTFFLESATLESQERKNLLNIAAGNGEEHFQSYLSNWLWLYDCTDSGNNFQT